MTKINLNQFVKIRFNDLGYQKFVDNAKEYLKYNINYPVKDFDFFKSRADDDGYTKIQFWEFMNIFGDVTFHGAPTYYEMNIIILDDE